MRAASSVGWPTLPVATRMRCSPSRSQEGPPVSAEEMLWLAQAVRGHIPQQYKFKFGLWTLSLIRALIHRQFGKALSLSTVSRDMKLLGFTAQKPLYQAWQRDATLVC